MTPTPVSIVDVASEQNQSTKTTLQTMKATTLKNVRFHEADIVEFEPTIWTATVASEGVPVGLSVNVRRRTRRRLDSFESERCSNRIDRQEYMEYGYLDPEERLDMLENSCYSNTIICHIERETMRVNRERWENNEYDLMYQFDLGDSTAMEMNENEENPDFEITQESESPFDNDDLMEGSTNQPIDDLYYTYSKQESDEESPITIMGTYNDDWTWNFTNECILSESEVNCEELPYSKDSIQPTSLRFMNMSTSPTDISTSECMVSTCGSVKRSFTVTLSPNESMSPITA